MSNLISGKEALIALANGEDVEVQYIGKKNWEDIKQNKFSLTIFDNNRYLFRIKPRTIKIEITEDYSAALSSTVKGSNVSINFNSNDDAVKFYKAIYELMYKHQENSLTN